MNNLCTDISYNSVIKYGEQLCGDKVELVEQGENSCVIVLADGLGSGVKANILATLTSKIISTMVANNLSLEDCVETVALTLPVCNVRKIAYSTFTIIRIANNKEAEIIQYDNPQVILLRDGKSIDYPKISEEIEGKTIFKSKIPLCENDVFIAMSDGAIYAGVGKTMNFGWQRDNIITFMEDMYQPDYTAKALCNILLDECSRLYDGQPGDDTTIGVIKIRKRAQVNVLFGPPEKPEDAPKMHSQFFSNEGKYIICGGTTSALAAEYLKKPLTTSLDYLDPEIPPTAYIEGVDLVTEGVITMSKVLEYAKAYLDSSELYSDWSFKKDGASRIARILFEEATDINFYVGRAVNPAHQNPGLPISFNIKMRIVEQLGECLKKMGKRVTISYF